MAAIRSAIEQRRLIEIILHAVYQALGEEDCPGCEVQALAIEFRLNQNGAEFRPRRIRVRPEYRRPPLDGGG
jgi:hypothetical protein